jgi:tetratricopeptide (TPR) repeat protein
LRRIQATLACNRTSLAVQNNRGKILNTLGRFSEAETILKEGRELLPGDRMLINNLAEAYRKQGKLSDALALYSDLTTMTVDEHENLGLLYAESDSLDAALVHYGEVLKQAPGRSQTVYSIAGIHFIKGKLDRAIQGYKAYLASPDPNPVLVRRSTMRLRQAYASRGLELLQTGDPAGAIAILEKRLVLGEARASDHHALAQAYGGAGTLGSAERAAREALRLDPAMTIANFTLANALHGRNDREAAAYYRAFLQGWQGDPRLVQVARSRLGLTP